MTKKTVIQKIPWIILCVVLLMSGTLTLIQLIGSKTFKNYKDYEQYNIIYKKILSKSEDDYYVYFYSNNCEHCKGIKKYIFQYLDSSKNSSLYGVPLYLFCIDDYLDELQSENDNIIGITDYSELKLKGTPTLILVSGKVASNSWTSPSSIKTQLLNT